MSQEWLCHYLPVKSYTRYRILGPLGRGGMGAVYLAEDLRLAGAARSRRTFPIRTPALRRLAQIRRQFQAEAGVLANLDHPNLPKVRTISPIGGNEYIVMEYVEGKIWRMLLPWQRRAAAGTIGPDLGRPGAGCAGVPARPTPHPILHRDIKPANIILTPQGKIKLVDFGLVRLLDPNNPRTATVMKGMGTLKYAPLEQYAGERRADGCAVGYLPFGA